jgi:signal peptidase I
MTRTRLLIALVVLGAVGLQAQGITYARGDLVRLQSSDGTIVTRKIVAIPGDRLRIDKSGLFVNDVATLVSPEFLASVDAWAETIPAGDYFVIQDAREGELLTRFWGLIPFDRVLGKVTP